MPVEVVSRVQVDSSTWMVLGKSPCRIVVSVDSQEGGSSDLDYGWLTLQSNLDLRSSQDNIEISSFNVSWDRNCDVDIADRLDPFIGQGGLFGVFFGFEFLVRFLSLFSSG